MKYLKKSIYLFYCISITLIAIDRRAMVIVPVADLVGAPIKTFGLAKTNKESYAKIGWCGGRNHPSDGTPRIFQALAHQTVEIISIEEGTNGDEGEACIALPSAFFITQDNQKPQNIFWTPLKNLLSYTKMRRKNIDMDRIPLTPSFKKSHQSPKENTIGLIEPFFDPITRQLFSVGTHFISDPEQSTPTHYAAFVFDRSVTDFKITFIPQSVSIPIIKRSPQEAIAQFVSLIRQWAHCKNGVIPYLWGGCSFTARCSPSFKETSQLLANKKRIAVYERPDCRICPRCGPDCAGLIILTAQLLCGIPYFYKNTYTLAHFMKSLAIDDPLDEGDLIWIPGHVMIVSDIKKNLLIEARGYSHEWGKVHQIALEKVFKGIKTYADLVHAFHMQQPLIRLNKSGKDVEQISYFKILKLSSVYKKM